MSVRGPMTAAAHPPVLDPGVRREEGGRLLVASSPGRLVRLTTAGSAALDRVLAGTPGPRDAGLARRLRERGLLHPVAGEPLAEVTFVIPVRDGGESLPALVGKLRRWGPVIVVDDGSADGSGGRAAAAGARLLSNTTGTRGPGAARNVGLAAATTEFVAFVDADCRCAEDWARPLAGLLAADPSLALAAPRVRGAAGPGLLAGYERARSPLDLGERPALVRPGGRVGYLPAAALVARRAALQQLDGFDPRLRFGEDVDLVWRALAAGWSARYAPEVAVEHLPRSRVAALVRQRFHYGGSAAALARRHRGAVAPLQVGRGAGLVLLGLLADGRRGAALAALAHVASAAARRRDTASAAPLALAAAQGLIVSGRHQSRALARDWLPLTLLSALASRRTRPYVALALALDAAEGARRDRRLLLPGRVGLRAIENAAYAAGLWHGALRERSAAALLPRARRSSGGWRS